MSWLCTVISKWIGCICPRRRRTCYAGSIIW